MHHLSPVVNRKRQSLPLEAYSLVTEEFKTKTV